MTDALRPHVDYQLTAGAMQYSQSRADRFGSLRGVVDISAGLARRVKNSAQATCGESALTVADRPRTGTMLKRSRSR